MLAVAIYIKDIYTNEYNRVDLFDDEKISVTSSIQNINDISKTFTDFSQTFTVPATKQNNKIFRHWYENSNDLPFSTLIKSDAYIEIDTIPFRSGKIQLESANLENGQAKDYSITFIGALGSLKDKFNGLYLKDLNSTAYDFNYSGSDVLSRITTATSSNVMFPLISSSRYWNYGSTTDVTNNINSATYPIRYNELFPALKLTAILSMIQSRFGIAFNGSFLSNAKFTSAYLYLKNADAFIFLNNLLINYSSETYGVDGPNPITSMNYTTEELTMGFRESDVDTQYRFRFNFEIKFTTSAVPYTVLVYKDNVLFVSINKTSTTTLNSFDLITSLPADEVYAGVYTFKIQSASALTFSDVKLKTFLIVTDLSPGGSGTLNFNTNYIQSASQSLNTNLSINQYFPNIKIEDFFSGLLKMFNLTCYSNDGINYTIEQLESYYTTGTTRDITKYIQSDSTNLNRVKTYKKINFEYDKSESLVNVGFMSSNKVEYGYLFFDTGNDGDEYNIKLPFEDLNFNNLQDKLQVGYTLKTDLQKYIPKPVILYDYNPTALTVLTGTTFYFSTALSGSGTGYTSYKAFGQEYFDGTDTYGLNFNSQQSTLTNDIINNSLYSQYYENYLTNIFDYKARLIKVSGILPTSLLTTLKLNDRLVIRDKRYLINTFTTDLTTGEVQFELLTDFRTL